MNGFTNAFLSLLLGWLRGVVNNFWNLLNSDGGGSFFQFLSGNWKALLLILCVGGFVIDRMIYFIRWRPYYVWNSRLQRLRRVEAAQPFDEEPESNPTPDVELPSYDELSSYAKTPIAQAPPTQFQPNPYMRPQAEPALETSSAPAYQTQSQGNQPRFAPLQQASEKLAAYLPPTRMNEATAHYAPIAQNISKEHTPYSRPYVPPADLEPIFDDDPINWESGATLMRSADQGAYLNPAKGMLNAFGAPQPEPIAYIRDMQAGFAPTPPPEQLYAPPATIPPIQPQEAPKGVVHPGLDSAVFRQNFGLTPDEALLEEEDDSSANAISDDQEPDSNSAARISIPSFMPYAQQQESAELKPARLRNPLAGIAKKARDLVRVENENNRPTIRDLQSTVDMRSAFHEPVYPVPKENKGSDY